MSYPPVMTCGPRLLSATLWLGSWLRGATPADDLWTALARAAPDSPALASVEGAQPGPLADLAAELRRGRADRTWLLLPRPGRVVGWPAETPTAPEPAALITSSAGSAWLLRHGRAGWLLDASPTATTSALVAESLGPRPAGRALAALLAQAAERLERLALDRPVDGALPDRWGAAVARLPADLDPAAVAVLARITLVRDALDAALSYDGAAVTAHEVRARTAELQAAAGALEDLMVAVVAGLNTSAAPVAWGR